MDEAWRWYRASLRASRHVGKRGVIIERMVGASLHEQATRRILSWSANPRVDSVLLRKALADTIAADAMTPPLSQNLKYEYLMFLRDLNELRVLVDDIPLPGGPLGNWSKRRFPEASGTVFSARRLRLSNDDERSRRLLRLLLANWLPQVDRPENERAPMAVSWPTPIFAPDSSAPASAQVLDAGGPRPAAQRKPAGQLHLPASRSELRPISDVDLGKRRSSGPRTAETRSPDHSPGCRSLQTRARQASCHCRRTAGITTSRPYPKVSGRTTRFPAIAKPFSPRNPPAHEARAKMDEATRDMKATTIRLAQTLAGQPLALVCALVIVGGLALTAGLWIWRIRDVSDVPDVGDPFDVADSAAALGRRRGRQCLRPLRSCRGEAGQTSRTTPASGAERDALGQDGSRGPVVRRSEPASARALAERYQSARRALLPAWHGVIHDFQAARLGPLAPVQAGAPGRRPPGSGRQTLRSMALVPRRSAMQPPLRAAWLDHGASPGR